MIVKKDLSLKYDSSGCVLIPKLNAKDVIDYRNQLGMTQSQFAETFDIAESTVRNWENGRTVPDISMARLQLFNKLYSNKSTIHMAAGVVEETLETM